MKTKFLSTLALTAVLFSACSKNDNTAQEADGRVRFTSGADAATRVGGADGDQWEGTESIGVYMVEPGTTDVYDNTANVEYTTTSTGSTASFESLTPLYYPVSGDKVSFIAYHPYNGSVDGYLYPVDLTDQGDQSGIDLMTAAADNNGIGYDKTYTGTVGLDFKHHLSKVVINVTAGDGIESLDGLSLVMEGMKTKAGFHIADGQLSNEADILDIAPCQENTADTFEAILFPVILDNTHIVKFTVDGNTYSWVISDNSGNITEFKEGEKYTFNVTIHKNRVGVTGYIEPWITVTGGTGVAN